MLKGILVLLAIAPLTAYAQQTTAGPPTEDDYKYFCGNFGERGTSTRDRCESRLRISRGVSTCDDVQWVVSCRTDAMTDRKQCAITASGSDLFVFAQGGKISFSVKGRSYPGSQSAIRVDQQAAVAFADRSGPTAAQESAIRRQIEGGKTLKTRYVRWPEGTHADSEVQICDLPAKLAEAAAQSN